MGQIHRNQFSPFNILQQNLGLVLNSQSPQNMTALVIGQFSIKAGIDIFNMGDIYQELR